MARPKSNASQPTAQQRMETVFWEMLAEMPYESITISALTKRAKVNHNTFYYYYECMDHMALRLFEKNLPDNLVSLLQAAILSGPSKVFEILGDQVIFDQMRKVYLFFRSGSPLLTQYLRSQFISSWCAAMGSHPEALSDIQQMELEFIFGGMASAMQHAFKDSAPVHPEAFFERPLFRALLSTLADIQNSSGKQGTSGF